MVGEALPFSRQRSRPGILATSIALVILLTLTAGSALAQESRGSVTGRVVDSSGGVLPGVAVSVVNNGTNAATNVVTTEAGTYTALYLLPGTYTVTATLTGFKTVKQGDIIVRVGDRVVIDLTMAPGGVEEQVLVTAQSPVLETGTATMGQVIDAKLISEIPLGDGTAYGLTRLIPGATFERSYALQRPMDNDNLRGMTVTGTISSEFSIDGSSNVVSQARAGIQPPAEAIQEFKVETAAYDAQVGHTGAGSVNLALKSGTNRLSLAGSFYNRDESRSEDLFASKRNNTGKTTRDYNRFGATGSGPIIKNKTFFMASFEKLQDDTEESFTTSVPTEKMRNGDFSELLGAGVQIFNPFSARLVNGIVTREPFTGNIIPREMLNPIALNVLKYYPMPNLPGTADLQSNLFVDQPWTYAYNFQMVRIDHQWSGGQRTYGRWLRNFRREERFNYAGLQNGINISQGGTDRFNRNFAFGHTAVLTPSTVLDVKASWLRFNDDLKPHELIDPAILGFPASTLSLFGGYQFIPRFTIEGGPAAGGTVATLGAQQSGFNTGRTQPFYNVQFAPTLTWTKGEHTIRVGYDWRQLRQVEVNQGWRGGAFGFDSGFTRSASNATGRYGHGIAAFLLGLPTTSSFIELRPEQDFAVVSHGFFAHDDWRVSDRLTLNIGLRYDLELGMTEAENRAVRAFDLTSPSPIQAQARAAYAALAPAGVPISATDFGNKLIGGYEYLSDTKSRMWTADKNNFQPRLGFTYRLTEPMIVRGGIGLFAAPFQVSGVPGLANPINQFGYSRNTLFPITADNGLTFQANLTNPLPSGTLLQPVGSSLGLSANLGGSPGTVFLDQRDNPQYWRYSIGVERQLSPSLLAEVSYLGQKGQNLPIVLPLNYVPEQFRTQSVIRDPSAEAFLTATVANPFQGLFPDNPGVNGATIARRRLLLQSPHFDALNIERYVGSNTYHGLVFRADKRFTSGFMLMTSYTWSHMREKAAPLNPWEPLEDRIATVDRPHRVTLATVAELPFGRNKRFGADWNSLVDSVLGGWQFTARYERQSGQPLTMGNLYFDQGCGDPKDVLKSRWDKDASGQIYGVDLPSFDTSCFYTLNGQPFRNTAGQPVTFGATEISLGAANLRRFPSTLEGVRFMKHHILDIGFSKNFALGGRARMQIRLEALNVTNYTLFGVGNVTLAPTNAAFGKVSNLDTSTVMKPRDVQLGVRFWF
jgi:hypothetical protein